MHNSLDSMWYEALRTIIRHGKRRDSRDGECFEILGYSGKLNCLDDNWLWSPHRRAKASYGAAELLWYLSGSEYGEQMTHYAKQYGRFLNQDGVATGAYGARWREHDQLKTAYDILARNDGSRQVVMTCWEPRDLHSAHKGGLKDIPCTCVLQFMLRDRALYLSVYMRSNDVWLGMPYDVWCFSTVQKLMASALGVNTGWYMHTVGSMHLYARNMEKAEGCLEFEPSESDWRYPVDEYGSWDRMMEGVRVAIHIEQLSRMSPGLTFTWSEENHGLLEECAAICAAHNGVEGPTWLNPNLLR